MGIEELLKALVLLADRLDEGVVRVAYIAPMWTVNVHLGSEHERRADSTDLGDAVCQLICKIAAHLESRMTSDRGTLGIVTSALLVARDYGPPAMTMGQARDHGSPARQS